MFLPEPLAGYGYLVITAPHTGKETLRLSILLWKRAENPVDTYFPCSLIPRSAEPASDEVKKFKPSPSPSLLSSAEVLPLEEQAATWSLKDARVLLDHLNSICLTPHIFLFMRDNFSVLCVSDAVGWGVFLCYFSLDMVIFHVFGIFASFWGEGGSFGTLRVPHSAPCFFFSSEKLKSKNNNSLLYNQISPRVRACA